MDTILWIGVKWTTPGHNPSPRIHEMLHCT